MKQFSIIFVSLISLVACEVIHRQPRSISSVDTRVLEEPELIAGVIATHVREFSASSGATAVYGIDLPNQFVEQLSHNARLANVRLIAKEHLKSKSDGDYAKVNGRWQRVLVLSFTVWEKRSSSSWVISLTQSLSPLASTTWTVEMRCEDGDWVLIKRTVMFVS